MSAVGLTSSIAVSALVPRHPLLDGTAMVDITPSASQRAAIAAIRTWYNSATRQQQVFRLFGYAGTGTSGVVKLLLEDLGLEPHQNAADGGSLAAGVVTATFTGKAAL